VPIAWGATASVAARYQFVDPEQFAVSPLVVEGDRYGADVTLSSPLGRALSASLIAGVSNESYEVVQANVRQEDEPELRIMLRLFARPDEKSRVSASYDSLNGASHLSGYRGGGSGLERWESDVNLQNNADEQKAMGNGSLSYAGNRGEVRLAHSSNFEDVDWQQASPTSQEQRSSVRLGTGLAFAGSHFAMGQPVRGGAFAIVSPSASDASRRSCGISRGCRRRIIRSTPGCSRSAPAP
jgi:outer membrane usher protein